MGEVTELLCRMRRQIEEWSDDEHYDDWWRYQRDYAEAAEALTTAQADIEALRAENAQLRKWRDGLICTVEYATRESRGGPQFPERQLVRMAYRTSWAEGHTCEQAEERLRAALSGIQP